jgi:hypothetical protein
LEEEGADALEVAAQAHEEGKAPPPPQVVFGNVYQAFFEHSSCERIKRLHSLDERLID